MLQTGWMGSMIKIFQRKSILYAVERVLFEICYYYCFFLIYRQLQRNAVVIGTEPNDLQVSQLECWILLRISWQKGNKMKNQTKKLLIFLMR